MKRLEGLIRLHRWQLDEKRRALADLLTLADQLAEEGRKLAEQMAREQEAAAVSETAPLGWAQFLAAMTQRRERLGKSRTHIERQIAHAREEVALAFQELKKYELAEAEREKRLAQRRKLRERIMFDEIAISRFQRNGSGQG